MAIVWAVTGSQFTADSARAETFKATSGARGVTLPGDLKVTATGTPSNQVQVAPGGATLPAGYPTAPGQSYGTLEATTKLVTIAATGSGGTVVKYLIQRVRDPQFEAFTPANVLTGPYDSFEIVSSLTGLNYPYVPLARIDQPASTATITNAMITDIRALTSPRMWREVSSSNNGTTSNLMSTTGERWPAYAPQFMVPSWANWVHVIVHVSQFQQASDFAEGELWPRIGGTMLGGPLWFDYDDLVDGVRYTIANTMSGIVPQAMRGTAQVFDLWGRRLNVATRPGFIRADIHTHIAYDVQFMEKIGIP